MFSARFLRSVSKIEEPEEARRFLRLDRYWRPELAEILLARVDELTPSKSIQAMGLAEVVVELVRRIRNCSRELQTRARCSLAAAQRECGELGAADANFVLASSFAEGCSLAVQAQVYRQHAVLLVQTGRPDEALQRVQAAVELDRKSETRNPNRSLVVEGAIRFLRGEYDKSAECSRIVLANADPKSELYVFAMVNFAAAISRQNLAAKDVVEARRFLRSIQERIKGIRETSVRFVVWHVEGLLHMLMEEYRLAINHFLQARAGFLRTKRISEFARVTVDLIEAYLKHGEIFRAEVTLVRSAKQILESGESEILADSFRAALALPIIEASDFLRARVATS